MSISGAIRWTALVRATGAVRPRPVGGDKRSGRIEAGGPVILQAVEAEPDITLAALRAMSAERGVAVAVSSLWRFFARRKITVQKDRACRGAGSSRHLEATAGLARRSLDLDPVPVFIDETGAGTKMARLRGRAPPGQRLRAGVPHGHWKTTTFTGALRQSGMTAPMVR